MKRVTVNRFTFTNLLEKLKIYTTDVFIGTKDLHQPFTFIFLIQTRAKYLSVGKSMKGYEDGKYEQWKDSVESTLPGLLKRNLLVKRHIQPTAPATPQLTNTGMGMEDKGEGRTSIVEIQGMYWVLDYCLTRAVSVSSFLIHLLFILKWLKLDFFVTVYFYFIWDIKKNFGLKISVIILSILFCS